MAYKDDEEYLCFLEQLKDEPKEEQEESFDNENNEDNDSSNKKPTKNRANQNVFYVPTDSLTKLQVIECKMLFRIIVC